jgi:peptidoglycan hydrolase-like protein with peptidoglycan-binding domain
MKKITWIIVVAVIILVSWYFFGDLLTGKTPPPGAGSAGGGSSSKATAKVAAPSGSTFPIKYGDKSDAVKSLQEALNGRYNAKLDVDGIYGPKTRAALTNNKFPIIIDFSAYVSIMGTEYYRKLLNDSAK